MTTETRTHTELKWQPEGKDDGTLPRTFRLMAWDIPQRRTRGRWVSTAAGTPRTVAGGITRAEMVAHIEDTADWLAFDGDNGYPPPAANSPSRDQESTS